MKHDIMILGAGAIGLAHAGIFHKNGSNVGVVAREKIVRKLKEKGLRLKGKTSYCVFENEKLRFYSETDVPEDSVTDDGLIIISSKTPDLTTIINMYIPKVYTQNSKQNLLMIQNGLNPEERVSAMLADKYPSISSQLVGSLIMGTSTLTDLETPTVNYLLKSIIIGSWSKYTAEKRNSMTKVLSDFLPNANEIEHIEFANCLEYKTLRYLKTIANGANVLSAIFGVKVGEVVDNPYLWESMKYKIMEGVEIARAEGIQISLEDTTKEMHHIYDVLVRDHYASMQQDIDRATKNPGKKLVTEINDLDLAFEAKGKLFGIPTPFNSDYGRLMAEFTVYFNSLAEKEHSIAITFLEKFIKKNQKMVGIGSNKNFDELMRTHNNHIPQKLHNNLRQLKDKYSLNLEPP